MDQFDVGATKAAVRPIRDGADEKKDEAEEKEEDIGHLLALVADQCASLQLSSMKAGCLEDEYVAVVDLYNDYERDYYDCCENFCRGHHRKGWWQQQSWHPSH